MSGQLPIMGDPAEPYEDRVELYEGRRELLRDADELLGDSGELLEDSGGPSEQLTPPPTRVPEPIRERRSRRLPPLPRGSHRCMVLCCGPEDITGVDMGSGAIVRLRTDDPESSESTLSAFDLIDTTWAKNPERDDLAQPEAVSVDGPPEPVGTLRGSRARRVLRRLVAPAEQNLLGFAGSSAPYWEFAGMRPSVALVVPSRGPLLFRRRSDRSVWARFGWPRSDNWLPVEDRRAIAVLWASRRDRLAGKDLAKALGFKPHFVVVTLSKPRDGYCYKTVSAILPRP
jgi:hypothetical protein